MRFRSVFPAIALAVAGIAGAARADVTVADDTRARALVEARRQAVLSSEIAAHIQSMTVEPGDAFEEGAPLVRFDCSGIEAARDGARAEVHAAEVTARQARRLEELRSIGASEAELAGAKADVARAALRKTEVEIGRCVVRAPFSGRVVERKAREHEFVAAGAPLLEILSDRDLRLTVIVPSSWLTWLKDGLPFTMRVDETGDTLQGEILHLGAKVDAVSQSVKITGKPKGPVPASLIPGMSGSVVFPAAAVAGAGRDPAVDVVR